MRKLKDSEMKHALRLLVDSINSLRKKNNRESKRERVTAADPLMMHLKHTDPNGCVGAFENGRMVGFASSIIRDNQWYLGYLFVRPGRWDRGIGRRLLKRVLTTADRDEINLFSLCTFIYNPLAIALYSSFGMTPQSVIVSMKWIRKRDDKLRLRRPEHKLVAKQIDDYENLTFINRLDKVNRGITRPEDHKFFIDHDKSRLVRFSEGEKPVGYAVLYETGQIAPVSAVDATYLIDVVSNCVRRQLDAECEEIALKCAGSNQTMVQYLLRAGFRMEDPILLMSNRLFGNMNCYLPASMAIF
jgi:RimJ/RimL family protein N-acetyltransferase